jgi:nitrate reductase NapE component
MTQPRGDDGSGRFTTGQQPPTQEFPQQRRSGCGTVLVALLVLAIITAIVILLGAFGLLGWIFS